MDLLGNILINRYEDSNTHNEKGKNREIKAH